MSQNITSLKLHCDPESIESMQTALSQYAALIQSGEAFRNTYCKVYFEFSSPIDLESYPDQRLIKLIETYTFGAYREDEAFTSETLLFLHAVQFPELVPALAKVGEAMRERGRLVNNWYNLFVAQSQFFALNSLFILAWHYPEYGYLLTGFLPTHEKYLTPGVYKRIRSYADKYGVTEDTTKAWCYCDHPGIRHFMFATDIDDVDDDAEYDKPISDLYTQLQGNADAYRRFREILIQRFVEQPFLPYEEYLDPYDTWGKDVTPETQNQQPVTYFYGSLLACGLNDFDCSDRDMGFTHAILMLNDEANEMLQTIENQIGKPLASTIDPWAEKRAGIRYYSYRTAGHEWSEFIRHHVANGSVLWAYVTKGESPDALTKMPAIDLYTESERTISLCDMRHFADIDSAEEFEERFHLLVEEYVHDELTDERWDGGEGRVLRFFDLIYRLRAGKPLGDEIESLLVNQYKLITAEQYQARYLCEIEVDQAATELYKLLELMQEPDESKLSQAYRIVCQYREGALEWFDSLDEELEEEAYVFAVMLVGAEGVAPENADALHGRCLDYVETECVPRILNRMQRTLTRNHMEGDVKDLYERTWQGFLAYVDGKLDGTSDGTAEALDSKLAMFREPVDSSFWDRRIGYEGPFRFEHDHYLLVALWLLADIPLRCQTALQRILISSSAVEPLNLISALHVFYVHDTESRIINEKNEKQLLNHLDRLGIEKTYYYAWLLDNRLYRYAAPRLDHYANAYGLSEAGSELRLTFDNVFMQVDQYARVKFLTKVEETFENAPEHVRHRLEEEAFWAIENWLTRNLMRPEQRFYQVLSKEQQLGHAEAAFDLFDDEERDEYFDFLDQLTIDVPYDEMMQSISEHHPRRTKLPYVVQKQGSGYRVLTNDWLVRAIQLGSDHISLDDDLYPSVYVVSDTVDAALIDRLIEEVENRAFDQQVQQVLRYVRGEIPLSDVKHLVIGTKFKPLDYLPDHTEYYAVDELEKYLDGQAWKRLHVLMENDASEGIFDKIKRSFWLSK